MKDVGLQPERTALAWTRTGWAGGAIAILCARLATGEHWFALGILAVAVSGLSVAIMVACICRSRHLQHGHATVRPWLAAAVAAWLSGVSGVVLISLILRSHITPI